MSSCQRPDLRPGDLCRTILQVSDRKDRVGTYAMGEVTFCNDDWVEIRCRDGLRVGGRRADFEKWESK